MQSLISALETPLTKASKSRIAATTQIQRAAILWPPPAGATAGFAASGGAAIGGGGGTGGGAVAAGAAVAAGSIAWPQLTQNFAVSVLTAPQAAQVLETGVRLFPHVWQNRAWSLFSAPQCWQFIVSDSRSYLFFGQKLKPAIPQSNATTKHVLPPAVDM